MVATGEHGCQEPQPIGVGHGVVVGVGDDLADGGREAAVASGTEAAIVGADQAHVVAQSDLGAAVGRAVVDHDHLVFGVVEV